MYRILPLLLGLYLASCSFSSTPRTEEQMEIDRGYNFLSGGETFYDDGRYESALQLFQQAYNLFTLVDHIPGKIEASLANARAHHSLNDNAQATYWLKNAENLLDEQTAELRSEVDLTTAEFLFAEGKYDKLMELAGAERIEDYPVEVRAQVNAYNLIARSREGDDYEDAYDELTSLRSDLAGLYEDEELEDPLVLSFVYYSLGYIDVSEEEWGSAKRNVEAAMEIDKRYTNYRGVADNLFTLGFIAGAQEEWVEARSNYYRSSEIFSFLNDDYNAQRALIRVYESDLQMYPEDASILENLESLAENTEFEELRSEIDNILSDYR